MLVTAVGVGRSDISRAYRNRKFIPWFGCLALLPEIIGAWELPQVL